MGEKERRPSHENSFLLEIDLVRDGDRLDSGSETCTRPLLSLVYYGAPLITINVAEVIETHGLRRP